MYAHYWRTIPSIDTNLPLRLAGKAQLFFGFRTTINPDGNENVEKQYVTDMRKTTKATLNVTLLQISLPTIH